MNNLIFDYKWYIDFYVKIMWDHIYEHYFKAYYAIKLKNNNAYDLNHFQQYLKNIKNWCETDVIEEYKILINNNPIGNKLTKIIEFIIYEWMKEESYDDNINLWISLKKIIWTSFLTWAKSLYYSVYLFYDDVHDVSPNDIINNKNEIMKIIKYCVEEVIKIVNIPNICDNLKLKNSSSTEWFKWIKWNIAPLQLTNPKNDNLKIIDNKCDEKNKLIMDEYNNDNHSDISTLIISKTKTDSQKKPLKNKSVDLSIIDLSLWKDNIVDNNIINNINPQKIIDNKY